MVQIKLEGDNRNGRFVLYENELEAGEMTFRWSGTTKFIIDHTGVEDEFAGKGYAKMLVMHGVAYAREKGVKIIPLCPYAKKLFERDQSIRDVLYESPANG